MNPADIKKILIKSGLKKGDTLMLHGDAGVSVSIISDRKNKLNIIFDEIIDYLGDKGTILVPTFTYSFCENKNFNVEKTQSQLGLFSETFRLKKNVKRTRHPIFSFAVYGNKSDYYLNASIKTCFGKNSIFELLKKDKGKISCLGCAFNQMTFIHHIEQSFGVDYRYLKKFKGYILYKDQKKFISTEYFVRNLNQSDHLNLELLYRYLKKEIFFFEVDFGRYNLITIQSNLLFNAAIELLKKNKYTLIGEKYLKN